MLARNDKGLDVADGPRAGNVTEVETAWTRAQAEMFFDCTGPWATGSCMGNGLWALRWKARLRRIQPVDQMIAEAGEAVVVQSLVSGLYRIFGKMTKNVARSKFGMPDILTSNLAGHLAHQRAPARSGPQRCLSKRRLRERRLVLGEEPSVALDGDPLSPLARLVTRRRRRQRGAALVEALIVSSMLMTMMAGGLFMHRLYAEKLRVMRESRLRAWQPAVSGCATGLGLGSIWNMLAVEPDPLRRNVRPELLGRRFELGQ